MSHQRLSTPEASKALGIPVHVISYWLGQIPYPAEQDENGQWRLTPEALGVLQTVKDLKERNHSMETIRRMVRELVDTPPPPPPPQAKAPPVRAPIKEPPAPRIDRAAAAPGADVLPALVPEASEGAAPPASPPPRIATPSGRTVEAPDPTVARSEEAPARAGKKPGTKAHPKAGLAASPPPGQHGSLAAAQVPGGDAGAIAAYVARAVQDALRQETVLSHRYAHAAHQIGKLEAENEHLRSMLNSAQRRYHREVDEVRARVAELEAEPVQTRTRTPWWAWLTMLALL